MKEHESPNRLDYTFVRLLLNERRRELQSLELNYRRMPSCDFLSCRRSLQQGIKELEALLLADRPEPP
jgi:hypothetical protein